MHRNCFRQHNPPPPPAVIAGDPAQCGADLLGDARRQPPHAGCRHAPGERDPWRTCSVCLMVEPLKEKGVNMAVASRSPTFDITRDFIDKIELQPMFVAQEKAVMVPSRKCCSVSRR
ncbi:hypothetical protein ZWY2020_027915 [Hordeum vulgare]|nr:hypothetical protein ZWY2020_027915 [Hordeum vulgare]